MEFKFGNQYDGEMLRSFALSVTQKLQSLTGRAGVAASAIRPLRLVSASDTIAMADDTVIADCTAAAVTLMLPAGLGADRAGATFTAGKIDAAHDLVIDGNGATINGAASHTNSTQWRCDTFKWMGAAWIISAHS